MAEKRVKFLSSRYPDAEAKPAPAEKPSEVAAPHAEPASVAMPAAVGAGSVQSSETPSDGAAAASPTGKRRAIGLLASGGAALAVSMGLGAGALGVWSEAASPDTYFDRWQNLNATGQSLSIASGVFGAVGIALLVPGAALLNAK